MGDYHTRMIRDLAIASLLGLTLLLASALANRDFPFPITPPRDSFACPHPGCSLPYDPYLIAMDYAFWAGIAFVLISALDFESTRFGHNPSKRAKEPLKSSISASPNTNEYGESTTKPDS